MSFCSCAYLLSPLQKRFSVLALLCATFFISPPALSAKIITSSGDHHNFSLADSVDVLSVVSSEQLSVQSVYKNHRQQFAPVRLNDARLMKNYSGPLWLRFAVFNNHEESQEIWLSGNIAAIQKLKLYRLVHLDNGQVDFVEEPDALLHHEYFASLLKKLNFEPGQKNYYYLYLERQKSLDFELRLLQPNVFFSERITKASGYGVGFGLLAMLVLFSGFLAIFKRSQVLLCQSLFGLLMLSFVISNLGVPRGWFGDLNAIYYALMASLFYLCNIIIIFQARAYLIQEGTPKPQRYFLVPLIFIFAGLSLVQIFWQQQDAMWLWLPALVAAVFTLNAYRKSYNASGNAFTLSILVIRAITFMLVIYVVYSADRVFALSKLLQPWMLYYIVIEGVLMIAMIIINDQRRYMQEQQQLLIAGSRNIQYQAQTALLSEVSHDLRSPVAGILGMADLLQSSLLTETQQEQLQAIKDSGQTLLNQISAVNDRLSLQQDHQTVQRSAFELAQLVEEAVFAFRLQAEQQNIEFVVNIQSDVPAIVEGDAARLRQVLQPLIANAVKYTSQGEVLVDVACLAGNSSLISFSVSDTGRGIAQQPLQELRKLNKQPYWQQQEQNAEPVRAEKGLVRVRQLLRQMNAVLSIDSKMGEGSCVSFQLELNALDNDASLDLDDMDYSILRNKRILIVDDNHSCCDVLKQQAKSWGMLVNTCYDGNEALAMFRAKANLNEDFDAIIIDYDMPHLSGLEVSKKIKEETEILPQIIMLTGLNVMPPEQVTRDAGIQTVITKPASRKLVKLTLSNLFHMQKRQQQNSSLADRPKSCRVLIAEDNDVSRRIISKMMELLSVDYKLVADGQLAVDAVQRERFDVILMDCEMPVMNGFQATEAILNWQKNKQQVATPIIALSAHIMGEHKQRALAVGMQDFLEKPVKLAELEAVIQRFRP